MTDAPNRAIGLWAWPVAAALTAGALWPWLDAWLLWFDAQPTGRRGLYLALLVLGAGWASLAVATLASWTYRRLRPAPAVQGVRDSVSRPVILAAYEVGMGPPPDEDRITFTNASDASAFNVTPVFEGLPDELAIEWPVGELRALYPRETVAVKPIVYERVARRDEDVHSQGLKRTSLAARLRSLPLEPPYQQAWTLRIGYRDVDGNGYETECAIAVNGDLGAIETRTVGRPVPRAGTVELERR